MLKIFIPILISISLFGSGLSIPKEKTYIDLGTEGHLYPILEKNFIEDLKEGVSELQKKFTKEYITKKLVKEIRKEANNKTSLGYCQYNNKTVSLNAYILPTDLYNPAGRIYKRKGEQIVIKNQKPLDLCFIKVESLEDAKKQIKFYDNIVKKVSGKQAECVYMVSGINALKLDKEFYPRMFYPIKESYEKNFGVSCYPTYIHIINDKRYNFETTISNIRGANK